MVAKKQAEWYVDPALADAIEEVLPDLAQEILDTIALEVPEYARPLEGSFGRGIRAGVDEALRQFVELVRYPASNRGSGRDIYVALGRGELRQGRSLDSLQAAYRVGARVAWQRTSQAAERAGHSPDRIYELADAIFAYIDQLSSESVEGYAEAQSARDGRREMSRSHLLAGLTTGAGESEIERLSGLAGWTMPAAAAAAACAPEDIGSIARGLGVETIAGTLGELGCVVIQDPDGPGAAVGLEKAARDRALTLGPKVDISDFESSWLEAQEGHGARLAGSLHPATGLLRTDDHLSDLALLAQASRLARISRRRLSVLDAETEASRERLSETLSVWLRHQGAIGPCSEALHVHPQTVRYRVARLKELLGEQLDDPDARFELALALRFRQSV